jgi:hypothetical protein
MTKSIAEGNAQVVDTFNGQPITRSQLSEAFDKVRPSTHWKDRIDAEVFVKNAEELALIQRSIVFFCGCHPTLTLVTENAAGQTWRVRAPGYWLSVGA